MILKRIAIIVSVLMLSINTSIGQKSTGTSPAGNWLASCDGAKIKLGEGYEISLITIDTGAYNPGYFSSEFYFSVDYVKDGQTAEFECSTQNELWTDFGINLYFSFSYSGSFSNNDLNFDSGSGYSVQNDHQLEEQFIKINSKYELVGSDKLIFTVGGTKYSFYRMNLEN